MFDHGLSGLPIWVTVLFLLSETYLLSYADEHNFVQLYKRKFIVNKILWTTVIHFLIIKIVNMMFPLFKVEPKNNCIPLPHHPMTIVNLHQICKVVVQFFHVFLICQKKQAEKWKPLLDHYVPMNLLLYHSFYRNKIFKNHLHWFLSFLVGLWLLLAPFVSPMMQTVLLFYLLKRENAFLNLF